MKGVCPWLSSLMGNFGLATPCRPGQHFLWTVLQAELLPGQPSLLCPSLSEVPVLDLS